MTKKCNRLRGERPKAFWGALVGGAMNLIGSAISSKSQARAIRRQIEAQKEAARTQLELANNSNLASTLNSYAAATRSYNDEDDYNLKYRLGGNKRLGSNRIYITDGGDATKIRNDTYLLRGGSHEQTNETGQTGIGINVGGNEIEAEGGEVAQKKNGALRIFSAQPILGGVSPAQAVMNGASKDKVFNAQQQFKRRNHLSDGGNTYKNGGTSNKPRFRRVKNYGVTDTTPCPNDEDKPNISTTRLNPFERLAKFASTNLMELGRTGLLDTEGLNVAQDSYLVPTRAIQAKMFADAGYTRDYNSEKNRDYGLVKKGVGNRNIPIYSRTNPNFGKQRKDLVVLGNSYNMNNVDKALVHAGSYPSAIYSDNEGNIYINSWDLNDYGADAAGNTGDFNDHYGSFRKKLAKSVDVIGNPTVVTTGYQRALDNNKPIKISNYNDYYNLSNNGYTEAIKESLDNWMEKQGVELNEVGYGSPLVEIVGKRKHRLGGRCKLRNGGLTSKDRGSSKHPYPSVSSKDFAGGGRSYPIPTKADAVDALRLAGLHGRSDVKTKVYSRYPELRHKARIGGSWKAPVYNTNKYRVSNRMRRQIATWEGSDFAGQNRRFKGDAIGAKERELRRMMGRTYNYLNDNQRDSLNSIYYNSRVDTFKNAFGKWFRNLNDAVDRGDERAFNNSLAGIRQSMTVGANRKGMSGLAKRRAWEQDWFGNPIPIDSNETKAILKRQAEARMVQPTDNTRVVIQPEYIEVPAPIGHGVVPVDNPDPNLLQGNIKDNLINMGNKFRLGQRCGGSTRMRKALGGESRPVKGMRSKLAWGDVVYPYRRNNNFDYWDIIDQEQKANDKGGITPWTTSNKYDVKVPYGITKSTPTIPYTSQVSTPTSKVTENKTIPTYIGNKSGMILRDADWYGLGADLVSSIGGSILGLGAYKNLDFNYNLPNFVEESPVALNTTYHNEAQKSNVERNRLNSRNSILRNTMSGSTAVGRMQGVDTNALYQLNQLADEKTNKETELMNQNLLNEQQVRARNAAARNQYYNTVASIKNAAIQAKNEAELAKGQILSGTLQGIGNSFQNLISQGRQNYDDTQAMLMGVAASDYATPSRLLELGVDVGDDAALAGIYRSAMNIPNPGARPKREDYSDNTEYSYALTRWENQNKAYQRRNSYADLIKGRMSKKNLIKYGII